MPLNTQNQNFDDKSMMSDAMMSEKYLSSDYNTYANECSDPNLRNEFLSILQEQHHIQAELYTEMSNRGWYQVENAEQQKIMDTKNKLMQQS